MGLGGGGAAGAGSGGATSGDASGSSTASAPSWREKLLGGRSLPAALAAVASALKAEIAAAVLPEPPAASATRARDPTARAPPPSGPGGASSLTVLPEAPPSAWQQQWARMHDTLGGHPIFARLSAALDAAGAPAGAAAARARASGGKPP